MDCHSFLTNFILCFNFRAVLYFICFGVDSTPFLELHKTEMPLMHSCSHDPEQIHKEVEVLRQEFNLRMKKIVFNSVLGAYYTSFVPCGFAQVIFVIYFILIVCILNLLISSPSKSVLMC